ncbi:hypothetical protein BOSEA31B_20516 [Hyphomicrobiales bacterium]|nr:hypothetical protein BOSEA31B_20516 [Hyphomicrobiales bacterium]
MLEREHRYHIAGWQFFDGDVGELRVLDDSEITMAGADPFEDEMRIHAVKRHI